MTWTLSDVFFLGITPGFVILFLYVAENKISKLEALKLAVVGIFVVLSYMLCVVGSLNFLGVK